MSRSQVRSDPISQRDYFALQAAFAPSGEFDEPIMTPMEQTDFKQHYPRIIAVDEARRAIRLFEQTLAGRVKWTPFFGPRGGIP